MDTVDGIESIRGLSLVRSVRLSHGELLSELLTGTAASLSMPKERPMTRWVMQTRGYHCIVA